ncbi:MAG TPA: hypothetical protein VHW24_08885 [Bryobacteraceae bacterium]|jgi:hypothetical protein|nr:hypothetical protein [Bryobacteraceae bacterium]
MSRFFLRHRFVITFGIAILATATLSSCTVANSFRGHITAEYDLALGHYKILTFGLGGPRQPLYAQILKERYGIEMQAVAGCVVTQSIVSYVSAYNAVSHAAANQKFGRDVFEEANSESVARFWGAAKPPAKQ